MIPTHPFIAPVLAVSDQASTELRASLDLKALNVGTSCALTCTLLENSLEILEKKTKLDDMIVSSYQTGFTKILCHANVLTVRVYLGLLTFANVMQMLWTHKAMQLQLLKIRILNIWMLYIHC